MTELEVKMNEMADKQFLKNNKTMEEDFKDGFRAALELPPEVKALIEALEFYSLKSNYSLVDEGRNYSVEYKCYELDEKTYGDVELGTRAQQALSTWKAFKGEENV